MLPLAADQLLLFLATTSLVPSTASADTATWLFPPYVANAPLVTFESQDTIDASWTSEFVAPVLRMFCETSNNGHFTINFQSPAPVLPNGTYAIPLDSVQDADAGCHLNLNETKGPLLLGTEHSSNSGNFLVNVQSDRSATTWSTSIAAATTSSSSSTITSTPTTTRTPASTPSPSSITPVAAAATATGNSTSPQTNTGLSSGAKAGIGVGVTVGVLALVLAALLLWMRARRKQRQDLPPGPRKQWFGGTYANEVNGTHSISEMDGGDRHEEKDGYPIARRQTAGELEVDPAR